VPQSFYPARAGLLSRLEDQEFRYRFNLDEMHGLDTRFSVKSFRPFMIQEEQQPTSLARRFPTSPAPVGNVGQPIWQENDR
jgi:hypothetical protein